MMPSAFLKRWTCHRFVSLLYKKNISNSATVFLFSRRHKSDLRETADPFCPKVSETIDVRSPNEFKEDHIPGAVNLPVLTNEQRSEIGTLYTQDSFNARKLGAGIIAVNISKHLETYFADKTKAYSPLIYCWRGGQRSRSMAIILSEIGFPVYVLQGGYKTYRKQVISDLQNLPTQFRYYVITGMTGTGKTYLLNKLEEHGEQVLDLEGLAKHKGSVLGQYYQQEQPSQKYWDTLLRNNLAKFDANRPVWVESEGAKVGKLQVPDVLFKEMCKARKFNIQLPMSERVKFTLKNYTFWTKDFELLKSALDKLRRIRGNKKIDDWMKLAEHKLWEEFVEVLLREHYDPTYTNSQNKNNWTSAYEAITMSDLSDSSVNNVIGQLISRTDM